MHFSILFFYIHIQMSANQMNTCISFVHLQTDTGVHLVCTHLYIYIYLISYSYYTGFTLV